MHHILCESPLFSRNFYVIRPLILWHILGAYFLLIWRVGVVKIGCPIRAHPSALRQVVCRQLNQRAFQNGDARKGDLAEKLRNLCCLLTGSDLFIKYSLAGAFQRRPHSTYPDNPHPLN